MKITWLGQAGLLFETNNSKIIIDPYLSDSVEKINPKNKRRIPVDNRFFNIKPDVIICTHNHLDHTDPETLSHYLTSEDPVVVLAPEAAWQTVRKFGSNNNYVLFNRHTSFTHKDVLFYATKAAHSDPHPIGVIIYAEGKKYYITGDTLYNDDIFSDIPCDIDAMFLPINGEGNNMNIADAKRFCKKVCAKKVVPIHHGLFDDIDAHEFDVNNCIVPTIYKEIKL